MKIKEISISYSESVNTGNFESVKWNITKVAELQDGDNPDDVRAELVKQVHDYAQKLIKRSIENRFRQTIGRCNQTITFIQFRWQLRVSRNRRF